MNKNMNTSECAYCVKLKHFNLLHIDCNKHFETEFILLHLQQRCNQVVSSNAHSTEVQRERLGLWL